jgi:hypothetical protein
MTGFILKTSDNTTIRFRFYNEDARIICSAFAVLLPFTIRFIKLGDPDRNSGSTMHRLYGN